MGTFPSKVPSPEVLARYRQEEERLNKYKEQLELLYKSMNKAEKRKWSDSESRNWSTKRGWKSAFWDYVRETDEPTSVKNFIDSMLSSMSQDRRQKAREKLGDIL